MYSYNYFRLKSYDDPLKCPEFILRLSEVQIVPSSALYHQDHLINIVQLNVKQILEFIKWVLITLFGLLKTINYYFAAKFTEHKKFVMKI